MDSGSNSLVDDQNSVKNFYDPNVEREEEEDDDAVLNLNNDETDLTDNLNLDESPTRDNSEKVDDDIPPSKQSRSDSKDVIKKVFVKNKKNQKNKNKFISQLVNQRRFITRDMTKPPSLLDLKPLKPPPLIGPAPGIKPMWTNHQLAPGVPLNDRKRPFGVDRPNLAAVPPGLDIINQQKQNPLLMVIVDRAYPSATLSSVHLALFREAVAKEIDRSADELPPRFEESALRKGAIVVLAVDPYARQWMHSKIHDICPWDNAQLRVGGLELFRPLHKASVWVPGIHDEPLVVLQRLGRYNPNLETESWRVNGAELRRFDDEEGRIFYLSIPDTALTALRELDFRPFYDLGRLNVLIDTNEIY